MSFSDILIRTFSGYIWIALILTIWFYRQPKKNLLHRMATYLFGFYIIGILVMTGIGKPGSFSPRLAWPPFEGLFTPGSWSLRFLEPFLNVILFFPLGFFLPLLYRANRSFSQTLLSGFLFSLCIEGLQMFCSGVSDISDLVCNTLGTVFGFLLFLILNKKLYLKRFLTSSKQGTPEKWLIFISCFLVMTTLQPYLISTFFNLG